MGATEITRTAFDRVQRDLGCEFMDWEGWYWPSHFGDPVAEHHAVRNDVGVWDASPLRKWGFSGAGALAAADRVFTNDMLGLTAGRCGTRRSATRTGRWSATARSSSWTRRTASSSRRSTPISTTSTASSTGLDVEITAMTELMPQVGINGPRARELLQSICEADVSSLRYFRFWPEHVNVGGVPCWVSRTGYSGELGFELFCSPDDAEQLWAAVVGAGARPYGLAAVETIRIESGLIFIGYDYFQHETSPFDMSLDKLIRLAGTEFCGKAALAAEAGDPPRRLVTLVLDGGDVPEYGAAVTKDGAPVGTLTSPCESPTLGKVIGMAVLESSCAATGDRVEVAVGDGNVAATVATLPIYDPGKARPRA